MSTRGQPRDEAVFLEDSPLGVVVESRPRKIQIKRDGTHNVTLNPDWLNSLDLSNQGAPIHQALYQGRKPLILMEPAIILQPPGVIGYE